MVGPCYLIASQNPGYLCTHTCAFCTPEHKPMIDSSSGRHNSSTLSEALPPPRRVLTRLLLPLLLALQGAGRLWTLQELH